MQKDMECDVQMHNIIQTNQKIESVFCVTQWNYKIVFVFHFCVRESFEKTKFVLQSYRSNKNPFWREFCHEQNGALKSKHSARFGYFQ